MMSHIKRFFCILAVMVLFPAFSVYAQPPERQIYDSREVSDRISRGYRWLEKNSDTESAGESQADWYMLTGYVMGFENSYDEYCDSAEAVLVEKLGHLEDYYLTEPARTAAAIYIISGRTVDFSAADYSDAGDNEIIWYIIAQKLNGGEYEGCMKLLLEHQNGGFGFSGQPDADISAMALNVLEKGSSQAEETLDFLEEYYQKSWNNISTETVSQLIAGLCSQGINPAQSIEFTSESGIRPVDILFSRQTEDGGFSHIEGSEADIISTQQALTALAALSRFSQDGEGLFSEKRLSSDIFTQQNIISESFDSYDLSALEKTGEAIADEKMLNNLYERAVRFSADEDTLNKIETKREACLERKQKAEELNEEIRQGFYPPEKVGITKYQSLKALNRRIRKFESDSQYILAYDELYAREKKLKVIILIIAAAVVSAAFAAVYFIRRKGSKK